MKLQTKDIVIIVLFLTFLVLVTIPVYKDKHGCEVARPNYKCESAYNVLKENCIYWAKFNCNTSADPSLPQIVWYIKNLCEIANSHHDYGYPCDQPEKVCNMVLNKTVCPVRMK